MCKILLESRAMHRDEMLPILDKLVACAVPEESKRAVSELIANEKYHYIEPHHIDRIKSFKVLEEHFTVPYASRFEEGEFRKRIQFMYGGKLERIKFRYTGPSAEAVLDRLPTAEIVKEAVSMGYASHQAGTCGLHVHVNRNSFGSTEALQDTCIACVLYFFEKN